MKAWLLAAVVGVGACRVDDLTLDGKRCPCTDGWVCETATDTCVRSADDAAPIDVVSADAATVDGAGPDGAPRDGGPDGLTVDAGIDAMPGPTCLASAGGATLYTDDFADLIGWSTRGGAWAATGGEAVQSSTAGGLAYAFPAGTAGFTDYRVAVQARRTGGASSGAMELALRIQSSGDGQYHCAWSPVTGALALAWTRANGTEGGVLTSTTVAVGAIPGYDATAPVVLEAQAQGGQLACCVRGIAGASVTATDTRYTAGSPGLRTAAQATAFDDVVVAAP